MRQGSLTKKNPQRTDQVPWKRQAADLMRMARNAQNEEAQSPKMSGTPASPMQRCGNWLRTVRGFYVAIITASASCFRWKRNSDIFNVAFRELIIFHSEFVLFRVNFFFLLPSFLTSYNMCSYKTQTNSCVFSAWWVKKKKKRRRRALEINSFTSKLKS